MKKTLYGVFDSSPDVNQAIKTLRLKGWDSEKITVIANKKDDLLFANEYRDPAVEIIANKEDHTFIEKAKHFFLNEGSVDIRNRLGNFGLSDSESTAYINEVEAGKFLIFLDEQPPVENEERVIPQADNPLKTGIVNNPDPNLFPETTANTYQTNEVDAQPAKSKELHGNSSDIFENKEMDTKQAQEREIRANSTERYKESKPGSYEGTIASDPHVDPFSADKTSNRADGTIQQDSDDLSNLEDPYIENRINTDKL
jgi:hypothetical protein